MIGDTATRLRNLATRLKTGQYDGADIMEAWIALREFAKYQWQSIETAPKDQTLVLIFEPDFGVSTAACHACSGEWLIRFSAYTAHPTHWMPLPPEPENI